MATAAPIGAGIGASTSPDEIKETYHAFYWSAAFVAAAAIIGNYFFSDKKDIDKLKKENEWLRSNPKLELINEGTGEFKTPFGNKGKGNARWKLYKTNKWIDAGPNVKYHQDLKIEKVVPQKSGDK